MNRDITSRVSIIIVNWNGQKWLRRCIAALQKQTHKDTEIILVDNASSDSSVDYIEKEFPDIKLIKNPANLGFAGGNNLGIAVAKGEYIMLLNNDTWATETLVEDLLSSLSEHNLSVIAPRVISYDEAGAIEDCLLKLDIFGHPFPVPYSDEIKPFYLSGICLLFKKQLYEETKGLDDDFFMYFEDTDWFWRLRLLRKTFDVSKEVCIRHAGHGSTGNMGGLSYKRFLWRNENKLQMLLKNYRASTLCFVLPVYFLKNMVEIVCFCILLKPGIAWTYVRGWWFNVRHLRRTLGKRHWVQANRIRSDLEITREMYKGIGEIRHLVAYIRKLKARSNDE